MNQVLFLCSGNYYRSRYAEEFFKFRASEVLRNWSADSRGLSLNPHNSGAVANIVLHRLAALNIQPVNVGRNPEPVKKADLDASSLVVAVSRREHHSLMKELFPLHAERIVYWDVDDTAIMPSDVAFPRIEFLTEKLIEHIRVSGQVDHLKLE